MRHIILNLGLVRVLSFEILLEQLAQTIDQSSNVVVVQVGSGVVVSCELDEEDSVTFVLVCSNVR